MGVHGARERRRDGRRAKVPSSSSASGPTGRGGRVVALGRCDSAVVCSSAVRLSGWKSEQARRDGMPMPCSPSSPFFWRPDSVTGRSRACSAFRSLFLFAAKKQRGDPGSIGRIRFVWRGTIANCVRSTRMAGDTCSSVVSSCAVGRMRTGPARTLAATVVLGHSARPATQARADAVNRLVNVAAAVRRFRIRPLGTVSGSVVTLSAPRPA